MLLPKSFLLGAVIMLSSLITVLDAQRVSAAEKIRVYVGTYTRGSESKGIYQLLMDTESGKLSHIGTTENVDNPSFLAIHPTQKYLYAVNEIADFQGTKAGAVSAFAIDPETGKLTLLNQLSSKGAAPCHLDIDDTGRTLLVANYTGGNICSLRLRKNGKLKKEVSVVQHTGSSVNPRRQKAPHAHSINLDLQNQHAIVADLGIDQLLVYQFNPENGVLKPNSIPGIKMASGAGPRHFAFHTTGKWGYVINELNRTITAMKYNAKQGSFEEIQTISTVPEETPAKGNSTAEVQVHPSGKFLYGSNRGPNTIAMYQIDQQTGKLTSTGFESTGGEIPRNFKIDPTGKFLLAANQNTHNVVVFKINQETGTLQNT
ncbi:MAG: lactonase family protein, partial [Planctomycetes bacterium]|nr:lactonase family protein [Planctomycetota bacterium]